MRLLLLPLGAFVVLTAASSDRVQQAEVSDERRLEPPASLVIPSVDQPTTLLEVLRAYEQLTDQRFVMHDATHAHLQATEVGLDVALDVPADALDSVVGVLLEANSIAVTTRFEQGPRLLELHDFTTTNPVVFFEPANHIDIDQLEDYATRPASAVSTTVFLEHLDAAQVARDLPRLRRAETDECFALGDHSLLLAGYADELLHVVRMLQVTDERQKRIHEASVDLVAEADRRRELIRQARSEALERRESLPSQRSRR